MNEYKECKNYESGIMNETGINRNLKFGYRLEVGSAEGRSIGNRQ